MFLGGFLVEGGVGGGGGFGGEGGGGGHFEGVGLCVEVLLTRVIWWWDGRLVVSNILYVLR